MKEFDLSTLNPTDVRELPLLELQQLSDQIRSFIIDVVSRTGGHIGANLATVEATVALHYCFESPLDSLIFDTGHIGYAHKIITGRGPMFETLNSFRGMSRFVSRSESEHDFIEASHAGTAISLAVGRAIAVRNLGLPHWTVAFVGDGAITEGLSLEALNHASAEDNLRMLIVLNDNGYAISPGYGAIHRHLSRRSIGDGAGDPLFSALGYRAVGPINGHSIGDLVREMDASKAEPGITLLHIKTEKGMGLTAASKHPYRMHFSFPFNIETGQLLQTSKSVKSYQDVAATAIKDLMTDDDLVSVVTPSTIYATGLAEVFEMFPERCFDPGMVEQHAMTMSVGMALGGLKPIVFYQSTFMQRAFDQLFHDVCFSNQNILILSVRSGFAGYDNPTHHGIYDLSYLRCLPNLSIYYPRGSQDLYDTIFHIMKNPSGPCVVLMPYGPVGHPELSVIPKCTDISLPDVLRDGRDGLILTVGNKVSDCEEVVAHLSKLGLKYGLVHVRSLKPLPDVALFEMMKDYDHIVTVEEAVLEGGFGSSISALLHRLGHRGRLTQIGLPNVFVEAGSNSELAHLFGIDPSGIVKSVLASREGF